MRSKVATSKTSNKRYMKTTFLSLLLFIGCTLKKPTPPTPPQDPPKMNIIVVTYNTGKLDTMTIMGTPMLDSAGRLYRVGYGLDTLQLADNVNVVQLNPF